MLLSAKSTSRSVMNYLSELSDPLSLGSVSVNSGLVNWSKCDPVCTFNFAEKFLDFFHLCVGLVGCSGVKLLSTT